VPGPAGSQGPAGSNGQGVAAGGLVNQALVKLSNNNYDTGWATITSGGGTWGSITGTLSNQTDLQSALDGKLSLSGGTMSGEIIFSTDGTNDSLIGAWGFGVENTNNDNAYIEPNNIVVTQFVPANPPDSPLSFTRTVTIAGGGITSNQNDPNIGDYGFTLNPNAVGGTVNSDNGWLLNTDGVQGGYEGSFFRLDGNGFTSGRQDDDGVGFTKALGLRFSDGTYQTTAFLGYTGTTSQYIRGDGSVATYGPLGDRYLTSSTSTMTCDSGNGKTMTVGTGLSYSPQQDITVSYNNANHMHGTVLTYNSTTGVMTWDSNTHSGSGTYSNWEVNVGGVAGAILPVGGTNGQVLAKINSTNFNTEWVSLGTMSTEPASAYLSTASAVANYQTIAGMSAYLSTAAASSTYLTQSNASSTYLTQSNASTTYIGTSAYATTAQAQAGTSTTTVVSPSTLLDAKYFAGGKSMVQIAWSTSVSGTGASAGAQNSNARLNIAPTTATGYAIASAVIANNSRGSIYNSGFDFSKRVQFGVRVARNVASPDSASVFRFSIGKSSGTDASDLSAKGLMIKVSGSGALQLLVHNGTALTTTTSSFTPANGQAYDVIVTSDGAGNCALFVNGSSVATSTGGPTTAGATNASYLMFEVQNTSIITGSPQNICVSDYHVQVNS
jgi:hypothetical protein